MPVVETLTFGFLTGFVANIAYDRTRNFIDYMKQGDRLVNHDLQKAVRRAYLASLQNIAMDCQKKSEKDKSLLNRILSRSDELRWLKQKRNFLAKELEQVKKEPFVEIPMESLNEIESLLRPSGVAAEAVIQAVREKLVAEALEDESNMPACYEKAVRADLFDRMSLHFAWEIKNTPNVRHIFQTQILTQIDATQTDTLQRLQNMEDLLQRLCNLFGLQQIADVRWMLEINMNISSFMMQSNDLAEQLKHHSGDSSLVPVRMEGENKIVLVFEGSRQGFEKILSLFRANKLIEVLNIPVEDVLVETAAAEEHQIKRVAEIPKPLVISVPQSVNLSGSQQRRLKQKLERLEKQETLLNEKIEYLQNVYVDKADDSHKFQVKKELEGVEKELEKVENKISEIYQQIENL